MGDNVSAYVCTHVLLKAKLGGWPAGALCAGHTHFSQWQN